jgi:thymidine phosphorylase
MTGWNHPKGHTLEDLIQKARTHPVTALTTLTQEHKRELLDRGVVLCQDVLSRTDLLKSLGIGQKAIDDILEEGSAVCTI